MPLITCRECGQTHSTDRTALFCSVPCRKAFNNRRMVRGSQLYDLFMMLRYQRGIAKMHGLWAIICRIAQEWRAEDERERDGRHSWQSFDAVNPGLLPYRIQIMGGHLDRTRIAVENSISARSIRAGRA